MTYTVIFEKGPTSWGAYVPDLPGVISVGGHSRRSRAADSSSFGAAPGGACGRRLAVPPPSSFAGEIKVHSAA